MKTVSWEKIIIALTLMLICFTMGCATRHFVLKPNNLNELGPVPNGKARIIFFSPTDVVSYLNTGSLLLSDGESEIGPLTGKSYFVYETVPGNHIFGASINRLRFDFIKAEIEAKKTYYIWNSMVDSFVVGAFPRISPVKKDSELMLKLDGWLQDLKQSIYNNEGLEYLQNEKKKEKDKEKLISAKEKWLSDPASDSKDKLLPEDGL
jgi:hypothetical protein